MSAAHRITSVYVTYLQLICNFQIVRMGETPKASKKKQKMASASGNCQRDWGKVSRRIIRGFSQ